MAAREEWMVIGRVLGPFGVRGELKVEPLTDFPGRYRRLERIYVGPHHIPHELVAVRDHQKHLLIRLGGVDSPEDARRFQQQDLAVPRADAVALPTGHYYLEDLIGIEAETVEGRSLGVVEEVLRTGANDVFIVGRGRNQILVPSTREAIRELDLAGRRLVVEQWVLALDEEQQGSPSS
jgi:16S rRNA processing protein RimM